MIKSITKSSDEYLQQNNDLLQKLKSGVALKKAGGWISCSKMSDGYLFGAGVLGDGLGALADGVLGQLTREEKPNRGLDFAARDGRLAVVVGELGGLVGDALEDVVDERVHDAHGLARDARVGVHLLQHLVDVDGVGLLSSAFSLALAFRALGRRLDCLLRSLGWGLRWWCHC